MSNPLAALKIDHWWHAFTVVGGAGMVAAASIKVSPLNQTDAFGVFVGLFLFGVGQWINHPVQVRLEPGMKITGYHRNAYPLGLCLELLGGIIFLIKIYRILFP